MFYYLSARKVNCLLPILCYQITNNILDESPPKQTHSFLFIPTLEPSLGFLLSKLPDFSLDPPHLVFVVL